LPGRIIDYLSFYFSSFTILLKLAKKDDAIVAKTDPPLISVVAAVIAKLKRAHLYNWLQDLFPEVAAELKVKFAHGLPYEIIKKIRNKTLLQAKMNIAIGELFAEKLKVEGIPKEKITIIHNWANEDQLKLIPHTKNLFRKKWNLEGKFVVGYSGNLGRSHNFSTIISAAENLKNDNHIRFLFIGGGAQLEDIKQECLHKGLNNVLFKPYQPREKLSESLSVSDLHLVSLKPELEGLILPCKFYGILAVGRPVLFIGSLEGELSTIINSQKCGYVVAQGDADHLTKSILQEAKHKSAEQEENALRIRKLFEDQFSKSRAISQFIEVFSET
jgi:glycosyltransferase involved in cell wall biosynthesis